MKYKFYFLFFLIITQYSYSQRSTDDSLSMMSFDDLKIAFFENEVKNTSLANKLVNSYIIKAKTEKDTFHLGYGYIYKSYLNDFKIALTYTDSIINLTEEYKNKDFPALGYMLKGYYYFDNGNDEKALNLYLKAYNYALKNNNISQQVEIKQFVGGIKTIFGEYNEALKIFREQLQFIKLQKDYESNYEYDYIIALNDLSKAYLRGKQLDSAEIRINEGINFSLKTKDSSMYSSFLLDSGTLFYYKDNYKQALDSLKKVEPNLGGVSLANCYYYQGKIHKQKNINKTVFYYNKIDSVYSATDNPFLELKDVYKTLYDYYSTQNNIEKSLYAVDRLIKVDSVLSKTIKNVNNQIVKEYQIPKLKSEKEKLINEISEEKNSRNLLLSLLLLVLLLITVFLIYAYRKQKTYKQRFDDLLLTINTKKTNLEKEEKTKEKTIDIADDVINRILKELKSFENKNKFLDVDITLNKLAKSFNTNSVYLSKTVNHHRGLSFSNYLNELRLDYCLEELNTNNQLRAYTIKAIAGEVGFNSAESFSNAFLNKTGLKPSFYLKELNKRTRN